MPDNTQYADDSPDWYQQPAMTYAEMVQRHDRQLSDLMTWRSEVRGAMQLVKYTLGTSIISGVLGIIAILQNFR